MATMRAQIRLCRPGTVLGRFRPSFRPIYPSSSIPRGLSISQWQQPSPRLPFLAKRSYSSSQSPQENHGETNKNTTNNNTSPEDEDAGSYSETEHEHAVISTFDLFSIGIGPSSSHTVGPMRAGNIFVSDLMDAGLLDKVDRIRVEVYGSLALTGEGHMTPSALLLGLEGADVETVDTAYVPSRFAAIKETKKLFLGRGLSQQDSGGNEVDFDYRRDFVWEWGRKLPLHSNGMRFSVFNRDGVLLATNDLFSVGGGFVVNGALSVKAHYPESEQTSPSGQDAGQDAVLPASPTTSSEPSSTAKHPADLAENLFYKEIKRSNAAGDRRTGSGTKTTLESDETGVLPVGSAGISGETAVEGPEATGSGGPSDQPRYPFRDAASLLHICRQHNLTIAQVVYENEKSYGYSDDDIFRKLGRIWQVMDNSILEGVQAPMNSTLPGSLKLERRAPALYKRLTRGLYPTQGPTTLSPKKLGGGGGAGGGRHGLPVPAEHKHDQEHHTDHIDHSTPKTEETMTTAEDHDTSIAVRPTVSGHIGRRRHHHRRLHGSLVHPIQPPPTRRTMFPAMDYLTLYAIAVNETNAAGGRIVTAPTNGAAGIIPSVLKYMVEFISDDPERDILNFLLTAAAFGMLYKRGATISAAEGGCMAEVGVACSMAAGAFAACMGAEPEVIEQAAEIGIEHNLGLTCDPIGGLVQAPCIERNALGAIKAVSSANLALSNEGGTTPKVRLDDAIHAMRLTARGMRNEFKETSLSGLATSVPLHIPVSVPDC